MLRVGLTGGIGCGKSVVADMFHKLGVTVIDADQIAHNLVKPDGPLLAAVIKLFGEAYLDTDGGLNRKKLAAHVFALPEQKMRLEALIHPAVRDAIRQQLAACSQETYVIVAIPLLLETGYTELVDRILVVDCDEQQQIQRVQQRDSRDTKQIQNIMRQQIGRYERLSQADDILTNNTSLAALQEQVAELHQKYLNLPA
jgi:dephospho-CoA kinase